MEPRLEAASRAGDLGAFLRLLQEDSLLLDRPSTTPYPSNNPLHIAALLGHADFAREILSRKLQLANDLNEQGFSPLHLASANGHLSVVKELLEVGSGLCLIQDKDGFTPIHTAAIKGRISIVEVLIDACPKAAEAETFQRETVVHLAVKSNRSDVVECLVEKLGGDDKLLNSKDEKGNTILHLAVARKQLQILKFLLSKPAIQVNSVNLKGFTPLDVLLESPGEHGDLVLGEMIRAAGGKKAEEESPPAAQSHPIQRDISPVSTSSARSNRKGWLRHFFKARASRRAPREERDPDILMVVATLIATVTFQAGMSPPGGFGQSDGPQSSTSTANGPNASEDGKAVLGDKLSVFLIFDMAGLFLSLSIILLLICWVPRQKRILTKFLKWVMWIAVFCTAIAFAAALYQTLPVSATSASTISIFVLGWCGIFGIAMIWLLIRFILYLLRTARCLKKRSSGTDDSGSTAVKRTLITVGVFVIVGFLDMIVVNLVFDVLQF